MARASAKDAPTKEGATSPIPARRPHGHAPVASNSYRGSPTAQAPPITPRIAAQAKRAQALACCSGVLSALHKMGVAELIAAGLSSDSSKVLQRAVAEFESDLQRNVLGKMPLSNSDFDGRFEAAISRGLTSLARSCVRLENEGVDVSELKRCARLFRARADDLLYWANQQNVMAKDELFNRINAVIAVAFDEVEVRFYERVVRGAATPLDPAAFDAAAADIIARARDGVISACLETMREHVRFLSDEGLEHLVRLFNERSDRALRTWHAHNKGRLARHKARMELAAAREKEKEKEKERAGQAPAPAGPSSPSAAAAAAAAGEPAAGPSGAARRVEAAGTPEKREGSPASPPPPPPSPPARPTGTALCPFSLQAEDSAADRGGLGSAFTAAAAATAASFSIDLTVSEPEGEAAPATETAAASPGKAAAGAPAGTPGKPGAGAHAVPCGLPPASPVDCTVITLLDQPPLCRVRSASDASTATSGAEEEEEEEEAEAPRGLPASRPRAPAAAPSPPAGKAGPSPSPKPRSAPVSPAAAAPRLALSSPAPAPWKPAGRRPAPSPPLPKVNPPRTSSRNRTPATAGAPLSRSSSMAEPVARLQAGRPGADAGAEADDEVVIVQPSPRPERIRPGTQREEEGRGFRGHDDGALSELVEAAAGAHHEPIVGINPKSGTVEFTRVGHLRGRRSEHDAMRSWGSKFATEWILTDPKEEGAEDSSDEDEAAAAARGEMCARKRVCS
eukprot:tig00001530_g9265.t1